MKIRQLTKKEQRVEVRDKVKELPNKPELSQIIMKNVMALEEYKYAKNIMVYLALPDEVDTGLLLKDALLNKDTVAVPVTREDIHLVVIDKNTKFVKGQFDVLEPESGLEITDTELAIIPMVAYDREGNRLGHGKGYYDRFLLGKKCFKIGVAFSVQGFEKLSISPTDIKMDMIVTEEGVIYN